MRWEDGRRSENVEDRRRLGGGAKIGGGLGIIALAVIALLMGADPALVARLMGSGGGGGLLPSKTAPSKPRPTDPEEDKLAEFVSVVLADTEDTWTRLFREHGQTYRQPKLVLFSGAVKSACGHAKAAMGPFYCPGDHKVYIDLSFYEELSKRHNAPGDFAQAYVVAHEVGHHVQNLLGYSERVQSRRERISKAQYNELSVRLELQADYLAGVWAHHAQKVRKVLEPGDIEEALKAASAIGDDRLQMESKGYVVPESFTHGTSAQRTKYFRKGFESGDASKAALDWFFSTKDL